MNLHSSESDPPGLRSLILDDLRFDAVETPPRENPRGGKEFLWKLATLVWEEGESYIRSKILNFRECSCFPFTSSPWVGCFN